LRRERISGAVSVKILRVDKKRVHLDKENNVSTITEENRDKAFRRLIKKRNTLLVGNHERSIWIGNIRRLDSFIEFLTKYVCPEFLWCFV
jgi:hypothetical protein